MNRFQRIIRANCFWESLRVTHSGWTIASEPFRWTASSESFQTNYFYWLWLCNRGMLGVYFAFFLFITLIHVNERVVFLNSYLFPTQLLCWWIYILFLVDLCCWNCDLLFRVFLFFWVLICDDQVGTKELVPSWNCKPSLFCLLIILFIYHFVYISLVNVSFLLLFGRSWAPGGRQVTKLGGGVLTVCRGLLWHESLSVLCWCVCALSRVISKKVISRDCPLGVPRSLYSQH